MDWYSTALDLAGADPPTDRIIDGISLVPLLKMGKEVNRTIFYYRGNEMMAVRYGPYKAHYWTWSNSLEEYNQVTYMTAIITSTHQVTFFPGYRFLSWRKHS